MSVVFEAVGGNLCIVLNREVKWLKENKIREIAYKFWIGYVCVLVLNVLKEEIVFIFFLLSWFVNYILGIVVKIKLNNVCKVFKCNVG